MVATRYIHPHAIDAETADHDWGQDVVSEVVPNYPRWVAELCEPYLGKSVLEVGAGYGTVTQHFVKGREVVAVDSSPECFKMLEARFEGMPDVEVIGGDLRRLELERTFDSVVMINTLEHIPDDVGALVDLKALLNPGGRLVLYVPAFNFFYGPYDRKVGHQRRYTKAMMTAVMKEAGLQPLALQYVNVLGMAPWLVFTKWLKQDPADRWASKLWDRTGTVASRAIERHVRVPVGLNLFAVGA
jgi:SAM-dependent methyltransferase